MVHLDLDSLSYPAFLGLVRKIRITPLMNERVGGRYCKHPAYKLPIVGSMSFSSVE
jgi:hypothetical protein